MFETGIKDLVNIMQMNYSSHLLFDKRFDGVFILKNVIQPTYWLSVFSCYITARHKR